MLVDLAFGLDLVVFLAAVVFTLFFAGTAFDAELLAALPVFLTGTDFLADAGLAAAFLAGAAFLATPALLFLGSVFLAIEWETTAFLTGALFLAATPVPTFLMGVRTLVAFLAGAAFFAGTTAAFLAEVAFLAGVRATAVFLAGALAVFLATTGFLAAVVFEGATDFLAATPPFFAPPVNLLTVAQARFSDSFSFSPCFSYPSSMCLACLFCLFE